MDQKKTIRPFSMKDKIGYTLGDLGCCFTEQYRAMYLSIFYTLILQVNPFHVGILLLVTKIWDAVNDPIIGAIVDSRKATKGGKFIPWIRAFSFPMAVLCILGFVNVGNINYGLRLAYMFVTYVLYEALYTCVNVPFGTLSSVMTDDVSQRTALSRYRSLGGTIFMTVMVMIGPPVPVCGQQARGWPLPDAGLHLRYAGPAVPADHLRVVQGARGSARASAGRKAELPARAQGDLSQ